jgi:hypothetical protein
MVDIKCLSNSTFRNYSKAVFKTFSLRFTAEESLLGRVSNPSGEKLGSFESPMP